MWPLVRLDSLLDPMMDDFDRVCFVGDSGDGETELRPNGLARLGEPFNRDGSIAMLVQ